MRARNLLLGTLVFAALATGLSGCAGKAAPEPTPVPPPAVTPVPEPTVDPALTALEDSLAAARAELEAANGRVAELERDLEESRGEVASLQERYAAIEIDLASAVEEILRTKSSARGVQNRAFATSRISEVRVQLESLGALDDTEVAARVERAREFLRRADQALTEENYGGASYLAERASELVRQAGIVGEVRARSSGIIAIVPTRRLEVVSNANLRDGPGLDRRRIGGLPAGTIVEADARSGDWYRIETEDGISAWIYHTLVK